MAQLHYYEGGLLAAQGGTCPLGSVNRVIRFLSVVKREMQIKREKERTIQREEREKERTMQKTQEKLGREKKLGRACDPRMAAHPPWDVHTYEENSSTQITQLHRGTTPPFISMAKVTTRRSRRLRLHLGGENWRLAGRTT